MAKIFTLHESHVPGKRLGRHVHHDPASRDFPAAGASRIVSVVHERHVSVFDQGEIGSCTGNAGAGCMSTGPFAQRYAEADAVDLYSAATHVDRVRGIYPPDDTGSSGLAIMRVLKARGLITSYGHTFSLDHLLRALVLGPGIIGIAWREGCDSPNADGVIAYSGQIRGGHEVEVAEIDVSRRLVGIWNSWGESWGLGGKFFMTFDDLGRALADHGDACFPAVPVAA